MSWVSGPITVAAGATVTINVTFGNTWQGPQFMLARPSVGLINVPQWVETIDRGVIHVARFGPFGTVIDNWIYTLTIREVFGTPTVAFIEGGKVP